MKDDERPIKRIKTEDTHAPLFHDTLLSAESIKVYAQQYEASTPYHHAVIPQLFQDDLLRHVRREIKDNLSFTEKETDIYKVNQTGDLANLDGLAGKEQSALTNLNRLRNALYSPVFRSFLESVTGVAPLSGNKIDMSINNYTQGCHLLNHDDVIGTRSVSYILYLPDPNEDWKREYGGALELYPVKSAGIPVNEPSVIRPPSWNQFIMFAVQPGHSFHSVEEVVGAGKERLSISGWFHVAQPGEDGHAGDGVQKREEEEEEEAAAKSTLEQLLAESEDAFVAYPEDLKSGEEEVAFSDQEAAVLGKLLQPAYLSLTTLSRINEQFCEDSHIQLAQVLKPDLADALNHVLLEQDKRDGIDGTCMTPHGTGVGDGWKIHGPPHRHRYMVLRDANDDDDDDTLDADRANEAAQRLAQVQTCLQSAAFRKWLSIVTSLVPVAHHASARRFRPGLDYTLATSNRQPLIDVSLCLTPKRDTTTAWDDGDVGGYTCFMAPNHDEDAAVYQSAREDEEEDGVLLTTQAGWNEMTIVMRDPGILSFTKYVGVRAGGSRWDCVAEYRVQE